jgi:D-glycero-alpha-D-manno-heptose-7-phosphate kinase
VGIQKAPELIAEYAIRCERVLAQESGGFQDQYHSAVGGFRYYKFGQDGTEFSPHLIGEKVTDFMNQSMVLVATLGRRDSSVHAKALKKSLQRAELTTSALEMRDLCYDISSRIEQTNNPEKILALLIEGTNEGWLRKQRQISNIDAEVEQIIKIGMNKGAQAAKLCGAGGSGFVLFLCDPERAYNVRKAFAQTQVVVPKIVNYGASAYEI